MKESPYTITVFNPKAVMRVGDYLVINDKKSYKIIHVDGTTVTYQLSLWERMLSFLRSTRWKVVLLIDDVKDWIIERIDAIRTP